MKAYVKALGFAAVLAVLPLASASADLVTNGGFETGDFTGWTLSGNTGFTDVTTSPVHSGSFVGQFGQPGSTGTLSQTLTTVVGQTYTLSYWLENGDEAPNSFEALINGADLSSIINSPAFGYTFYTFDFTAISTSTQLAFTFRQDPDYWYLDDISVTEAAATGAPEPASLALLGAGLAGFGTLRRKRK